MHAQEPIGRLIVGVASGVDQFAAQWAVDRGIDVQVFPAQWRRYGNAAGPIRSREMLGMQPDSLVAFDGGKGTEFTLREAEKRGVPVEDQRGKFATSYEGLRGAAPERNPHRFRADSYQIGSGPAQQGFSPDIYASYGALKSGHEYGETANDYRWQAMEFMPQDDYADMMYDRRAEDIWSYFQNSTVEVENEPIRNYRPDLEPLLEASGNVDASQQDVRYSKRWGGASAWMRASTRCRGGD